MSRYREIVKSDETLEPVFKPIREEELKNNQKVKKVTEVKTPDFEIKLEN